MKKLTAGIFASILGLTAMGAADAAVTSKAYVDGLVGGINTSLESKAEQSALNQEITDRKAADSAIETAYKAADTALSGQISSEALARENADNSLQLQINNKAEQAYVGTIPTDASSQNVVDYVIERTSGLASEGVIEGKLNKNLGTENANKVVVTDASGAITAAAKIEQAQVNGLVDALGAKADAQTVTDLTTTVSGKADKTELKDWVLTETYDAGQKTQDDAITALQTKTANMATTTDVDTAKSGAISEAASDAATKYAKIAYEGKVDALEGSQKTQDDAISALQTKTADMATTVDVNTAKAEAISEAASDAATKYAAIAYEDKVDALDASQATQNTAITALEQFETSVKDAVKTVNNEEGTGEYALTMKLVDDGTGTGAKKPEFVWEQIVRQ